VGDAQRGRVSASVEAVVPDLVQRVRQDVLDEAAEKLDGVEVDRLAILGAKG